MVLYTRPIQRLSLDSLCEIHGFMRLTNGPIGVCLNNRSNRVPRRRCDVLYLQVVYGLLTLYLRSLGDSVFAQNRDRRPSPASTDVIRQSVSPPCAVTFCMSIFATANTFPDELFNMRLETLMLFPLIPIQFA